MKKIISFILFFTLIFAGCASHKDMNYSSGIRTNTIGTQVTNTTNYSFKRTDFNNFCKSQHISYNLNMWFKTAFKDYETQKAINELVYLKDDNTDDGIVSNVYRLRLKIEPVNDTTFVVNFRKTTQK